jgi:alpha-amylase
MKSTCTDTTLLGSFLENHDIPRFASQTSDLSLQKNAIAFTMLADGIPIIYAGQEQQYAGGAVPADREATWLSGYNTGSVLYGFVKQLNQIRSRAVAQDSAYVTYKAVPSQPETNTIVLRKGSAGAQVVGVFSNRGASGATYTLTVSASNSGFVANQALVEVLGCTAYTTDSSGNIAVAMAGGLPLVFYPAAQLAGSGICAGLTGMSSH